jgi:hypothetical protein
MISGLKEAIFDASTQLGSAACYAGNHRWVSVGGRGCPQNLTSRCSQLVYVCAECGVYDYGEPGGPGATDCSKYCQHRNLPGQSIVNEDTE